MVIIKLGSLFDGIGGFPYAGTFYGIIPVWASEIEPWPIKVTEKHFPGIKHLGDITQINGGEIEPVDIITFGSPCQDLSIAGKREGLAGERSGLFMEAVRIIREMRRATGGEYPRFAVWENVPGAFSSNKGQDFRAVLEEIGNAEIPMPKSGRWATAGMVRTETADIAWRVLDAQYHGVPQRRRRIFLVADFAGQCASEILFIEEGLRGHFAESGEAREEAAATVGDGVENASGIIPFDTTQIVMAVGYQESPDIAHCVRSQPSKADKPDSTTYVIQNATRVKSQNGLGISQDDVSYTLDSLGNHAVAYPEPANALLGKANLSFRSDTDNIVQQGYAVRRLTPLECLRLQGFPDYWLDIEGMSDTQKYRSIGNSVAIPCVSFILRRISEVLRRV